MPACYIGWPVITILQFSEVMSHCQCYFLCTIWLLKTHFDSVIRFWWLIRLPGTAFLMIRVSFWPGCFCRCPENLNVLSLIWASLGRHLVMHWGTFHTQSETRFHTLNNQKSPICHKKLWSLFTLWYLFRGHPFMTSTRRRRIHKKNQGYWLPFSLSTWDWPLPLWTFTWCRHEIHITLLKQLVQCPSGPKT